MNADLDSEAYPTLVTRAKDLMQRQVDFHGTQVGRAEALSRFALVEAVALVMLVAYLLRQGARPGPLMIGVLVVGSLASALALFTVRLLERGGPPPHAMAGPHEVDRVAAAAAKRGETMAGGEDPTLAICAYLVGANTRHLVRTSRLITAALFAMVASGTMVLEAIILIAGDGV